MLKQISFFFFFLLILSSCSLEDARPPNIQVVGAGLAKADGKDALKLDLRLTNPNRFTMQFQILQGVILHEDNAMGQIPESRIIKIGPHSQIDTPLLILVDARKLLSMALKMLFEKNIQLRLEADILVIRGFLKKTVTINEELKVPLASLLNQR